MQPQEASAQTTTLPQNATSCPKAIVFDLDETLAPSFEAPTLEMIAELYRLLMLMPVAVMTGRDFPSMSKGFLPAITKTKFADRFYAFPEGGAQCFQWKERQWEALYAERLFEDERATIVRAIREAVEETGIMEGLVHYGEQYVQKKAMVAFAALGQEVPKDLKYSWDPGNVRRQNIRDAIAAKLPAYEVLLGGATSVDVTKKGINKAYGVRWLSEHLKIPPSEMLYIGDALYPGGNDNVVISTGIQTRATKNPDETFNIIEELLLRCG